MTPTNGGQATIVENNDSWSLLRLLDAGHVSANGSADRFRDQLPQPGRQRHV